jgi:hypothetical protein
VQYVPHRTVMGQAVNDHLRYLRSAWGPGRQGLAPIDSDDFAVEAIEADDDDPSP